MFVVLIDLVRASEKERWLAVPCTRSDRVSRPTLRRHTTLATLERPFSQSRHSPRSPLSTSYTIRTKYKHQYTREWNTHFSTSWTTNLPFIIILIKYMAPGNCSNTRVFFEYGKSSWYTDQTNCPCENDTGKSHCYSIGNSNSTSSLWRPRVRSETNGTIEQL